MAGYIGSKSSVTLVDGYTEAEADAEFVNDPSSVITVSGSNVGIGNTVQSSMVGTASMTIGTGVSGQAAVHTIYTNPNTYGALYFADATSGAARYQGGLEYQHPDDSLRFVTAATERMRIDSSGNLLVGTTATDTAAVGFRYRKSLNAISSVADGGISAYFGRRSSDGDIAVFRKDDTTVGSIGSYSSSYLYIGSTGGSDTHIGFVNGHVRPATATGAPLDNDLDLGHPVARWDDIYATNGTIQTSDFNEKQDIASLTATEMLVGRYSLP